MATGTVADERRERKRELETTKEELAAAMAKYAAAELAAAATGGEPESHPALVDRRVRRTALLAARGRPGVGVRPGPVGRRGGEGAVVPGVRRPDAPRGPRGVAGGDGRGAGAGVDGPVRLRRLRDERAPARAGHGRRGLDDADGAAHGEPRGVVVLLRRGGSAAGGAGGGELRGQAHRADDAFGRWRRGVAAGDGAVGRGVGVVRRRRRPAGAQAAERRGDPVRGAGRHGGAGAAVGDRGPGGEGRRSGGHAGGEGRRAVAHRAGRRGWPADRGRLGAVLRCGGERGGRRAGRLAGGAAAAAGYAPEDVGVCIGDGADWLRRLFDEWFPAAVSIVGFFHAAEYLWAAAGARYGPGSDLAKRWAAKLCRLLKAGRADEVLAALRRAGGAECGKAAGHIGKRRERMRYDEYLARGLPIGSGRAEAACKDGRRTAPQVHRHALERRRREPRPVGALCAAERLVRRLPGRTAPAGRVTVSVHSPRICRTSPLRPCGMRSFVVEEELVSGEVVADVRDGQGAVVEAPELGSRRAVGTLDDAVPLGSARRQDVQRDAELLAGVPELGHELAAAVQRAHGLPSRNRRVWPTRILPAPLRLDRQGSPRPARRSDRLHPRGRHRCARCGKKHGVVDPPLAACRHARAAATRRQRVRGNGNRPHRLQRRRRPESRG